MSTLMPKIFPLFVYTCTVHGALTSSVYTVCTVQTTPEPLPETGVLTNQIARKMRHSGHQVIGTLGHRDTGTPRYQDTKIPGHWDTVIPGHWDTGILEHWDTKTLGHWDTRTMGRVRVRVPTYRNRVVIFVLTVSGLCLDVLFFLCLVGVLRQRE